MILPLQLRHSETVDGEPAAWFLPGNCVTDWLVELARCGLAEAGTLLFIVPKSVKDRSPAGLLVVPERADAVRHKPAGLPCRLIAQRVFVPVDATLHPPIEDHEVRAACPLHFYFFHPVLGLSGFEAESAVHVWQLLDLPVERSNDWNFAQPGSPALPELQAIVLAQPPSTKDLFGGAESEIGVEPPLDLPPAPHEPKQNPLAESGRFLQRHMARFIAGAMRRIPHTGHQRTWANDVEDWANRQRRGVDENLEKIRNKELHRLLHLFETNPEAALRHALPMNDFAHRGLAPPGGNLASRVPNFDLSRLGGKAADHWHVPFDLQEVLRQRYREMADREMQLGRHRRAAYIYAELLGDLPSAANALKQGRHFREAALLIEEHLKNPLEAARCLAEGGLLVEAIERYEKLDRWLDVADVHERLGNMAAAQDAVQRVIDQRISSEDFLGAAKVTDERLQAPAKALDILIRAWNRSQRATGCLAAAFKVLARTGRHDASLDLVARLAREPVARRFVLPLLEDLLEPLQNYPDQQVRHRAEDFRRVLIAGQLSLPNLPADESRRLMDHLVRLAPQDRLLARDANRYRFSRREAERRAPQVTNPPSSHYQPEVVRRFKLPKEIAWIRLRHESNWFYAIGISQTQLTVVRGVWDGEIQSLSWPCEGDTLRIDSLIFEPTGEQGRSIALALAGGPPLALQTFPGSDLFFRQPCLVGTPPWFTSEHYPVAFGDETIWTAHLAAGRAVLSCHDKSGRLQRTIDISNDLLNGLEHDATTKLCLAAIGNGAAISLGNRVVLTRSSGGATRLDLPDQITRLQPTLPHTRVGLAILLNHGAYFHWVGEPGLIELERDIKSPLAAFVPGGPLALYSYKQILLLDLNQRGMQTISRVKVPGWDLVGVSPTCNLGEFATLDGKGEIVIYRKP